MPASACKGGRCMAARLMVAATVLATGAGAATAAGAQTTDLVSQTHFRVCADPANMPLSSRDGAGFENRIADLFAQALGRPLHYVWFPQTIGFVRRTLRENRCDVIIGFAQGHELVLNTNNYYSSAYVLLTRPDSDLAAVDFLGDPALQGRIIGVVAGSPPATHMARYGLIGKARPYRLMVDRRVQSPADDMVGHLLAGEIDAGILWGPIGGYHAKKAGLAMVPLLKEQGAPRLFYRITMGVRPGELVWKRKLNTLIRRQQAEIDAILTDYGVPLVNDRGDGLKPPT